MKEGPDRIDSLDLEVVKRILSLPHEAGGYGWPAADTEEAIRSYRAFLKLVRSYRVKCAEGSDGDAERPDHGPAPDPVTDIVWHTHILFTEKYHQDCDALFGAYIHHRPRVEDDASADHIPVGP